MSHREDLPLPTEPPYTAFVGNLTFDLIEADLEEFFAGSEVRCPILSGVHEFIGHIVEIRQNYQGQR